MYRSLVAAAIFGVALSSGHALPAAYAPRPPRAAGREHELPLQPMGQAAKTSEALSDATQGDLALVEEGQGTEEGVGEKNCCPCVVRTTDTEPHCKTVQESVDQDCALVCNRIFNADSDTFKLALHELSTNGASGSCEDSRFENVQDCVRKGNIRIFGSPHTTTLLE